jgi:small GTP-binding protein
MKNIVAGIVAHVDAGKTTLSEALLYQAGTLRQLGRVDKGDAFLDPDALEKRRGITIFTHQAELQCGDMRLTLIDTPGHVDFAAATEQALRALDYAVLVVSAPDGVQGYTRTLWRLLARYQVPTFIFVNKMDAPDVDKDQVLANLQASLAEGVVDFTTANADATLTAAQQEAIAVQDDDVLSDYLDSGELTTASVQGLIRARQVFPCYFGAALKLTGTAELLAGLARWTQASPATTDFGARVFKVTHDEKGERLTWLRVTGGILHAKDELLSGQKANQLRVYNGAKFTAVAELASGQVCAVSGLTDTYPGQGLGALADAATASIQPVLTYALNPGAADVHACLDALRQLEDEDPQLRVSWNSELQELRVQMMGPMQLEVLQQLLQDRFGLAVTFGAGSILYKETITAPIEGVGHFEPLRHYAEAHLLLTPTPAGSGLTFDGDCSLEVLASNWQHQVLSNLGAKTHRGVLTGAPITDMRITLVGGRASNVHTVGGDFREATWRAVRQGLMMARAEGRCQLLEPWYDFRLTVGQDQVGRAMNDIQQMSGYFDVPDAAPGAAFVTLTGAAPVAQMQDYAQTVRAYTHGQGQLECVVAGYKACHNADEVIAAVDYQPTADLDNTPDSVFCAHGAGYPVPWHELPQMAHYPYLPK